MSRARSIAKFGNESVIVGNFNDNVGVGTARPNTKLDVSGNVNITGILTASNGFNAGVGVTINTGGVNIASGVVTARSGVFTGGVSLPTAPFIGFATVITSNYVTPANQNTLSVGPLGINTGIAVTVTAGTRWVIV